MTDTAPPTGGKGEGQVCQLGRVAHANGQFVAPVLVAGVLGVSCPVRLRTLVRAVEHGFTLRAVDEGGYIERERERGRRERERGRERKRERERGGEERERGGEREREGEKREQ